MHGRDIDAQLEFKSEILSNVAARCIPFIGCKERQHWMRLHAKSGALNLQCGSQLIHKNIYIFFKSSGKELFGI